MFITLGIVRAAMSDRSGSVARPDAAGSLRSGGRARFGARLFGGPEPAGQDHPAEEAAGHEQERQQQASNHETSIVRAGVTDLGRITVRTPSRRSAAMPS